MKLQAHKWQHRGKKCGKVSYVIVMIITKLLLDSADMCYFT